MPDAHHLDAVRPYACLSTAFDEPAWRDEAERSNAEPIPRALVLRIETSGDIERLLREIELVAPHFDRDRDVVAVHVEAAVVPSPARLGALLGSLERHFHFAPAGRAARSLGVGARRVRHGDFAAFAALGFVQVKFASGPRDLDSALRGIAAAREQGVHRTGLEASLPASADRAGGPDLDAMIDAQPEQLALRLAEAPDGAAPIDTLATLATALHAGGYRDIGLDTRPLAWLEEGPYRIAGVTGPGPTPVPGQEVDLIGFGPGARMRIGDAVCENLADPDAWSAAIDAGRLPLWRGLTLDTEARLRTDVVGQWLRNGEIDIEAVERRYGIVFDEYFADALGRLEPCAREGLVSHMPSYVRATSRGRLMLRIMARCFDPPDPHR